MKIIYALLFALLVPVPSWGLDCTPGTVGSIDPACHGASQSQSQAQSQSQSVTTGTTSSHGIAIAPAVFAPGLAAGGIVCLGSKSGGVSVGVVGVGAGFSLGSTVEDEKCNARADALALAGLGDSDVARARLCQVVAIASAYATAGRPCPQASTMTPSGICPDGFPASVTGSCAKSRTYRP